MVQEFGLGGEFNWSDLKAFEELTGAYLTPSDCLFIRNSCNAYTSGINEFREDNSEPPYMSKAYKKRRDAVLKSIDATRKKELSQ